MRERELECASRHPSRAGGWRRGDPGLARSEVCGCAVREGEWGVGAGRRRMSSRGRSGLATGRDVCAGEDLARVGGDKGGGEWQRVFGV